MPTEPCQVLPPTFKTRTVVSFVFASSLWYLARTRNLSPWNCCGQWHCSQVSLAGRRCFTGEGMGLEYVLKVTAKT